jgi:hypothetical protein
VISDKSAPFSLLDGPPIFVVGAERSGTTWIFDLLRNHPLVAGVFESKLFTPGLGLSGLLQPQLWNGEGLASLLSREEGLDLARQLTANLLLRGVGPTQRFLAEKTPTHVLTMADIAEVVPGARFVHVVRDGRDVCVSRRAARRTWANTWGREPRGREVARTAKAWKRDVVAGRSATQQLGGTVLEARYERFVAEPVEQTRLLYAFAGLPDGDGEAESSVAATDFVGSGRADDPTGFYRGGRVGDWRQSFNLVDAIAFNLAAGDVLVDLGYEVNRQWSAPLHRHRPIASTD